MGAPVLLCCYCRRPAVDGFRYLSAWVGSFVRYRRACVSCLVLPDVLADVADGWQISGFYSPRSVSQTFKP